MSYEQLSSHPNTSHGRTRSRDRDNHDDEAELELLEETEGMAGEYINNSYRDSERNGNALEYAVPLSKEARKRLWWRNALVNLFYIACWFVFATLLSVYNKWMFSETRYGFKWPFFVTSLHMVVQFLLSSAVRYFFPRRFKPEFNPSREDYVKKVVPTAVTTGLDIGLSNQSLKLITLSFYTMCKSSTLIFVLFFAFLFRLERFSLRLVSVILLIFFGVLMMVATETQFSLPGFFLVLSGSALGGLRWSLTQLLLKDRKVGMSNPVATIFWLSPVQAGLLLVLSALTDSWREMFGSRFFESLAATMKTSVFLVFPGVLAFCMILSEVSIIQHAGVVPMSIAGIAKEVTTISISAWLFDDQLTPLNIVGVGITVSGIVLFTYHKYQKSVLEGRDASPRLGNGHLSTSMMMHGTDVDSRTYLEDEEDQEDVEPNSRSTTRLISLTREELDAKPLPPINGHGHGHGHGHSHSGAGSSADANVLFSIADSEDDNDNDEDGVVPTPKVHSSRKVTFAEQPLDEDGRVWTR